MMDPSMLVNGFRINLLGRESSQMHREIHMMVNGKMIKHMDLEFSSIKKHKQFMKVIGKTTCSMDQESKGMWMEVDMRECIRKEENMVKELIIFLI